MQSSVNINVLSETQLSVILLHVSLVVRWSSMGS